MLVRNFLTSTLPKAPLHQARAKSSSSMGISRKAIRPVAKSSKATPTQSEIKINYASKKPVLKGGSLTTKELSSLVTLYHSTQHHITKENLDAVIDAEFAPEDGQPRARPLMANLLDLHIEMGNPGKLTRPSAAAVTPASLSTPASPDYSGFGADAVLLEKDREAQGQQRLAEARGNDWIGSEAGELTPRQRMVIEALHGAEEGRRPGLELALGGMRRMQKEREEALAQEQ